MVKKYLPRCNAEHYHSVRDDYFCCLNNDKICEFRGKDLKECQKYREQILPRKHPFRLEVMT